MAGAEQEVMSLETLLRQLSMESADRLVDSLGGLGKVRLTCRFLRSFVDNSVRTLKLTLRTGVANPAEVPNLERWPRLTSLELVLDPEWPEEEDDEVGTISDQLQNLLLMPLTGQPLAARQRITSLAIRWEDDHIILDGLDVTQDALPPLAISTLPLWFPSLRDLNLDVPLSTAAPLHMRYMYDALATLPYLESLRVPDCSALDGIGALRNSLKRLRLRGPYVAPFELTKEAIPHLSQLSELKDLKLQMGSCTTLVLLELLNTLPVGKPAFELRLECTCLPSIEEDLHGTWDFSFRSGAIHSIGYAGGIERLPTAISSVLLPCGALGQRLELLTLSHLWLRAEPLTPERAEPLQALIKRCGRVELDEIIFSGIPTLAPVAQAVQLLGAPKGLALPGFEGRIEISTAAAFKAPAPAAEVPAALLEPADLLRRAVDSLAAAAAAVSQAPGDDTTPMLLARGSLVGALAFTPGAILPWLAELARAGSAPAAEGGDTQRAAFVQVLPGASAMLIGCKREPGAAAALLSAAAAAAQQQPPGMLEVMLVGAKWSERNAASVLRSHLQRVMQEALDAVPGISLAAGLEWAVEAFSFLAQLPKELRSEPDEEAEH
ncbi:hypothetical protein HYH03_007001 [Edaphochlamys debaryana]|uniref:Uncharacterized protein n=1 Tax=Edaphochlamys debaryana TaxID=47281 RepID=A0A836BZG1_9CHLO|nr:hypothetical protein HYH03_007001 [Edaphochlamys debaryana]|eukprot:KAG2494756.1 hypothetical protein HYH03_007001 [Edaphochlamys debaryana]